MLLEKTFNTHLIIIYIFYEFSFLYFYDLIVVLTERYDPITTKTVAKINSKPGVSPKINQAKKTPETGCEREIIVILEGRYFLSNQVCPIKPNPAIIIP